MKLLMKTTWPLFTWILLSCFLSSSMMRSDMTMYANAQKSIEKILSDEGSRMDPEIRKQVSEAIVRFGAQHAIDPFLLLAIIHVESHFRTTAVSNKGAVGLMQVTPVAAREVHNDLNLRTFNIKQLLTNHEVNIQIGSHYLASLVQLFKGDIVKALMAYNMGPTLVSQLYKKRVAPLEGYPKKVLKTYARYLKA